MKKFVSFLVLLYSFVTLGGPVPFTSSQFPVWYAVANIPQAAVSNASEVVLFQTAVPPQIIGNNGFMRFTLMVGSPDAAAATVTHAIKGYLGGTNAPIGGVWASGTGSGVPLFTNTFTTTVNAPVMEWVFPQGAGITNIVYSPTTTNSYNAFVSTNVVSVGTQTNGLFLTITGSTGGTGGATNIVNLNAAIIEALGGL